MESLTDVLLSDRTGHKYILVFRGMKFWNRQNKPIVMEAGQDLLLGMGAERRTGCWKALDLEGGLTHTGVCTCPLVRLQGELVCFSGCKFHLKKKKHMQQTGSGAEGPLSVQCVAELSRRGS